MSIIHEDTLTFRELLGKKQVKPAVAGLNAIRQKIKDAIVENANFGSACVYIRRDYRLIRFRTAFLWNPAKVSLHPLFEELIAELIEQEFDVRIVLPSNNYGDARLEIRWKEHDDGRHFVNMQPPDFVKPACLEGVD